MNNKHFIGQEVYYYGLPGTSTIESIYRANNNSEKILYKVFFRGSTYIDVPEEVLFESAEECEEYRKRLIEIVIKSFEETLNSD